MSRLMLLAVLSFSLCPLLAAQRPTEVALISTTESSAEISAGVAPAPADPQLSPVAERNQAIKKARTIHIDTHTAFLTTSTLERALMKQKNWDKLELNLINDSRCADLELQVNRVVFTHIHTYILTDRATGIVLAAGRARALDGVIASGPMAEQIVKVLSAARLPAHQANGN